MNDLDAIATECRRLMTAHGVGRLDFDFDRGKRRMGATYFQRVGAVRVPVRITLSRHFASVMTTDEIRDVMLHEIAHAQAGHAAGHGPLWKTKARALGIKPERCGTASAAPEAAWHGVCRRCGATVRKIHRAPLKVQLHGCAHTDTQLERLIEWHKHGRKVSILAMPERYRAHHAHALKVDTINALRKDKVSA